MTRYRLAKGVQVTWAGDEIHIDSGLGAEREITVQSDVILNILHGFSTARTVDEAVEMFGDEDSADDVRAAVNGLIEVGILVSADAPRVEPLHDSDFKSIISIDEHRRRVRERASQIPGLVWEDGAMTLTNTGKAKMSRGCVSCKEGKWLCVFPSFQCNADCDFCPQTRAEKQRPGLPVDDLENGLFPAIDKMAPVLTGVSVSGGELFLNLESAKKIIAFVKQRYPRIYTWAYTNGILATEPQLKELAALGTDEIRFDLAATKYSQKIVDKLTVAVREFPWVSVEVPSHDLTRRELIENGRLEELARIGVKQINLGEVTILDVDSPVYETFKDEEVYPLEVHAGYAVSRSRLITLDILEHAAKIGCPMVINDCSADTKLLQGLSRSIVRGDDGRK